MKQSLKLTILLFFYFYIFFCADSNIIKDLQSNLNQECGKRELVDGRIINNYDKNQNNLACPFCSSIKSQLDDKYLILKRTSHNILCLNLYPYLRGHLMVIPIKHVANLAELNSEESLDLINLLNFATELLKKWGALGFNIGLNLGEYAGASVLDHIHFHVLPRFKQNAGFTDFFTNLTILDAPLIKIYEELKALI